jgi:hypothetical protein
LTGRPVELAGFRFHASRDGRVQIEWRGRVVKTLAGAAAAKFLERAVGLGAPELQRLMAKATGNFRRGNERR